MDQIQLKLKTLTLTEKMGTQTDRVRFNVRGKIFETSTTTLSSVSRDSMFGAMLGDEWNQQPAEGNKEYFIDRNPDCFSALLDLLATGEFYVPPNVPEKLLYREAHYYGLLDHVRTAKWGQFDTNRLRLTRTVRSQDFNSCSAIRASPNGGCAVAHGGIVRVYNWMLEEHPALCLDYLRVNDIGWIDSENIVMSVCHGGMGVFSSSTGELRHRFQLDAGEGHVKDFTAGALCFDSDSKIFADCSRTSNYGIGVWDQVTGKQIDLFDSLQGTRHGTVNKIQWLNGCDCLFVNSLFNYRHHISLLDFRDKSIVWSWSDDTETSYVVDAIPMEESNSICAVSKYEDLGFLDLRSTKESIKWNSYLQFSARNHNPKLTSHGGQIFCSMYDKISVYNGRSNKWTLTNRLGVSQGGSIQDFSIGGDRLFALHDKENVFDVWETPSAPIV